MQLATSTNILCERKNAAPISLEESIRACAEAGFAHLDFGFAELAFFSQELHEDTWEKNIQRYERLSRSLGVDFIQGHACLYDFCNRREDSELRFELLKRSFRAASLLGIPRLVVHPACRMENGRAVSSTHAENVAFFQMLSDFAAPLGVDIAVENMWSGERPAGTPYAVRAEELLQLMQDVGRSNVGVCWDIEHASVEDLPQGDSIRLLGRYITATHVSDDTGPNNIHVLPYCGKLKWDEVLQAFAEIGYDGAFSLELQHYLWNMPMALCPEALRLARSVGTHLVNEIISRRVSL